jgi:hypothetical protein
MLQTVGGVVTEKALAHGKRLIVSANRKFIHAASVESGLLG